jgi:molecular chaperone DnaK (HSP70)
MQRLKEAAEKAKIELSSAQQTDVNLPYITALIFLKFINEVVDQTGIEVFAAQVGVTVGRQYFIDLRNDPLAMQRLKEAAEKAKIELSSAQQTDVNLSLSQRLLSDAASPAGRCAGQCPDLS